MRTREWTAGLLLAIVVLFYLYGQFWLKGARLYNDDYTVWLDRAAQAGFVDSFAGAFAPAWSDWGFQRRPVEVFATRLISSAAGVKPGFYFIVKILLWAATAALLAWIVSVATDSYGPPAALALTLAASAPVFSSILYYGDFLIVAQLFLTGATAFLLVHFHRGGQFRPGQRHGLLVAVFLCYLLAINSKASARVFFPALLCFAAANGWRGGLRRYGLLLLGMFVVSVPWGLLPGKLWPPFFPGLQGAVAGQWHPWNALDWGKMLFGGIAGLKSLASSLGQPPETVFTAYLPWLALALIYGIINVLSVAFGESAPDTTCGVARGAQTADSALVTLWGFWSLWALIGLGCAPAGDDFDRTRYLAELAVPVNGLAVLIFHRLCQPFGRKALRAGALGAVALTYALPNLFFTANLRTTRGVERVAINQVHTFIHQELKDAWVFFVDFPDDPHAYFPRQRTVVLSSLDRAALKAPASLPGGRDTYIVTQLDLSKIKGYDLAYEASGNSYTLYDRLFDTDVGTADGRRFYVYKVAPELREGRDVVGQRSESQPAEPR